MKLKKEKQEKILLRLPNSLLKQIDRELGESGYTRSEFIRILLSISLRIIKEVDKK